MLLSTFQYFQCLFHSWFTLFHVKPTPSTSKSMLANCPWIYINRNSKTKKNKVFHPSSKLVHKALKNHIFPLNVY